MRPTQTRLVVLIVIALVVGISAYLYSDAFVARARAFQDEDTAATCDNYFNTKHKCECNRAKMCPRDRPTGEDAKCHKHCKPDACKCIDPCTS